jgi:uncharacterized protein (TIGR02271 family)
MFDRNRIREGMVVRTEGGDKLGKVHALEPDGFIIEKGLLFKEDYLASYERILDVREDEIIYAPQAEERAGWTTSEGKRSEEVRVPLKEEELVAQKTVRQAGAVRVKKEVITEEKQVTVPVTREEVHVERVPVAPGTSAGKATFQEDEITVPVMEEEVEVKKRPVVREEVRIKKERREEPRTASQTVRREEAHVEDDTQRVRTDVTREEEGMRTPGLDPDRYRK